MLFYYLLIVIERFHDWPYLGGNLVNLGFMPITVVKIAGLATVAAAVFGIAPSGAAPRHRSFLGVLFVVFLILPVVSTVAFGEPIPTDSLSNVISLIFLLLATRKLLSTMARVKGAIRVLVLVSAFSTLWCFKESISKGGRAYGVGPDPNYEALALVMIVPLSIVARAHR